MMFLISTATQDIPIMFKPSYYLELRKLIGNGLLVYPAVAACIKNSEKEILLVKKRKSGIWGFPAGGVEPDETIYQALKREIKEEINADIAPTRLIAVYSTPKFDFTYPNGNKIHPLIFFFACRVIKKGDFSQNGEISEARYFSQKNLPGNMLPCCVQKAKDCQLRRKDTIIR